MMLSGAGSRKRPAPGSSVRLDNNNPFPNYMDGSQDENIGLLYSNPNITSHQPQISQPLGVQDNNQLVMMGNPYMQAPIMTNPQPIYNGVGGGSNEQSQTMEFPNDEDALRDVEKRISRAKSTRKQIPPFVQKLATFVNDPTSDEIIRWSDNGNSFIVLDEDSFSKNLIPDLFKHNNYASFVRQLNMYGFHKVVALSDGSMKTAEQRTKPRLEYSNPYFRRGQPDLMWLIQKPKSGKKKTPSRKGESFKHESDEDNSSEDGGDRAFEQELNERPNKTRLIEAGARPAPKPDMQHVLQQLDTIRQHQALISNAIQRLRKDHNQLYNQALAFQDLHERHETSITHILQFLATVYNKNIEGNPVNGFNFSNAVGTAQPGAMVNNQPVKSQGSVQISPNRPIKKRPLMIENGGNINTGSNGHTNGVVGNSNFQAGQNSFRPVPNIPVTRPPIQELDSPSSVIRSPSIQNSPRPKLTPTPSNLSTGIPLDNQNLSEPLKDLRIAQRISSPLARTHAANLVNDQLRNLESGQAALDQIASHSGEVTNNIKNILETFSGQVPHQLDGTGDFYSNFDPTAQLPDNEYLDNFLSTDFFEGGNSGLNYTLDPNFAANIVDGGQFVNDFDDVGNLGSLSENRIVSTSTNPSEVGSPETNELDDDIQNIEVSGPSAKRQRHQ